MIKKPLVNNRIRAREVRLIDETGKQVGVVLLEKALQMAQERNLDLVQVTDKVEPPVCKITDYGKYLYKLQKKEKKEKKTSEIKGIRLRFNISPHDMETRANQSEKFLRKGNLVKIEMLLRGREKGLGHFARKKINDFVQILNEKIPVKIESALKRAPNKFIMIVSKDQKQEERKEENK
ncbi:MAG: translation initiation factor IF-3 [Candidatus Nealsonbacteria bacterium]